MDVVCWVAEQLNAAAGVCFEGTNDVLAGLRSCKQQLSFRGQQCRVVGLFFPKFPRPLDCPR
jgi:hypothetical protein